MDKVWVVLGFVWNKIGYCEGKGSNDKLMNSVLSMARNQIGGTKK